MTNNTHYNPTQGTVQLWDYLIAINAPFMEGNIAKYVLRWRKKNGVQDLEKALDYIDKKIDAIRFGAPSFRETWPQQKLLKQMLFDNEVPTAEAEIIEMILHWRTMYSLYEVQNRINELMKEASNNE